MPCDSQPGSQYSIKGNSEQTNKDETFLLDCMTTVWLYMLVTGTETQEDQSLNLTGSVECHSDSL